VCVLHSTGSGYNPVARSCQRPNAPPASINDGEFLYKLGYYLSSVVERCHVYFTFLAIILLFLFL
jgi:hypothetical protein